MATTEEECRKFMTNISTLSEKNAVASEQLISLLQKKNEKLKEKVVILNTKNCEKDRQIAEIKRQLANLDKELETSRQSVVAREGVDQQNGDPLKDAGSSLRLVEKLNQQFEIEKGEKDKLIILLEEKLKTKSNLLEAACLEKDKFEDELSTAKLTILNNEAIREENMRHLTEREEQVRLLSLELEQEKLQSSELKRMYDASFQEKCNLEAELVLAKTEHRNSIASLRTEKDTSEKKLATQEHILAQVTMTLDGIRKLVNTGVDKGDSNPQVDPSLVSSQSREEQTQQHTPSEQQQLAQDSGSAQQYQTVYVQMENGTGGSNHQQDGYHVFDLLPGSVIPIYNQHEDLLQIPHSIPMPSSTPLLVQPEGHLAMPTNELKRTVADMEHSSDDDDDDDDDDARSGSVDDDHNSEPNVPEKRRYTEEELSRMRVSDGKRCLICPPEKQAHEHSSIKRHIMEVHRVKLKCYYCGKQYVRLDKLREHEKSLHGAIHVIPGRGRPKRNKTNG